ncbi:ribosome biogenesis protein [Candidatus Woesearchaeota archaeon]|nr:ribosome biogenesis protein [Candidatus Woesearchaeota archaeon]
MVSILKCKECGSYGLNAECACGAKRDPVKPPKFSPEDKYAKYRRKYKEQELENNSS